MVAFPVFTLNDIPRLWESTVGLEREALRIRPDQRVTQTDHPSTWGDRSHHPYLQTDFSESQVEFITPPFNNNQKVFDWMAALHQIAQQTLSSYEEAEVLWPYSMPPALDNLDQIRSAQLASQLEYDYRQYLIGIYGKKVQLVSGIHYNFQINDAFLNEKIASHASSRIQFRNDIYMDLTRKYLYYRWVLTYLLGATPLAASDYETELYGRPHSKAMKSIRQSRYGYQNSPDLKVSYQDFERFVTQVEDAVASGQLSMEKELYRDVRMRGAKPNRAMLKQGISYLEFRNFDLNPFECFGIALEDIDFLKLWILALLIHDQEISAADEEWSEAINQATAESHPLAPLEARDHFDAFSQTLLAVAKKLDDHFQKGHSYQDLIQAKLDQLVHPELTLAGKIYNLASCFDPLADTFYQFAINQQNQLLKHPYLLHGFERMELSTQALIKRALQNGIKVKVLDERDNLIQLSYEDHIEFVKSANYTSKDHQAAYFLMDNKSACKTILSQVGIHTPQGKTFDSLESALNYFPLLNWQQLVIKPQNTNYGIGISIFDQKPDYDRYRQALEEAFQADHTILIEEFIQGTELRFYVQANQVLAICERQPAQLIGDGQSTIHQLIALENQHPYRGPKHLAPLTLLEEGESERLTLQEQGLDFDSVPDKNQLVYLRRNSNVSSGGIAIDRTDQVHDDYRTIAIETAKAMQATFCGVDIIIRDYRLPIASSADYAVLEANYNPMMSLHLFPANGPAHPVDQAALDLLFPELTIY